MQEALGLIPPGALYFSVIILGDFQKNKQLFKCIYCERYFLQILKFYKFFLIFNNIPEECYLREVLFCVLTDKFWINWG